MEEGQNNYTDQLFIDMNLKIRDLESKQRILKDRLLLIGQNLIEIKEKINENMLKMKTEISSLKHQTEKLSSFLETASGEFSKFAKKEDLEILSKQARMFQPLELLKK